MLASAAASNGCSKNRVKGVKVVQVAGLWCFMQDAKLNSKLTLRKIKNVKFSPAIKVC